LKESPLPQFFLWHRKKNELGEGNFGSHEKIHLGGQGGNKG